MDKIIAFFIAVWMSVLPSNMGATTENVRMTELSEVNTWVSFYGQHQLGALSQFDLVDLDADPGLESAYSPQEIDKLQQMGSVVVSYLNLGAVEDFRDYNSEFSQYRLSEYEGWPGEYWIDIKQSQVQDLLITNARRIANQGVDGFYLDNLDIVLVYEDEQTKNGMLSMVKRLRQEFPDMLIISQNGIELMEEKLADGTYFWQLLDGVAVEEVYYEYDGSGYRKVGAFRTARMENQLESLRERGLPVFTLDYTTDRARAQEIITRSKEHGFVPYVSDVSLSRITNYIAQ